MDSEGLRPDTLLQHFAEEDKAFGAVTPPIVQTSLFVFDSLEDFDQARLVDIYGPIHHYSRLSNPTLDIAERKIAKLEGADACKLFGSGMAAMSAGVLSALGHNDHAVVVDTCYGPLRQFMVEYLGPKFGVRTTFVDGGDPEEVFDAVEADTKLIYLESPSSLVFRLQDIRAITAFARERGITTMMDNSYATPLYQRPIEMGVDIVVHSGTKYLAGHSDMCAGVLCTSQERMDKLIRDEVALLGAILPPFPAWLMIRSLRTLRVRIERHEQTGNTLAKWLETHPSVAQVNHISLQSNPQRELFLSQMQGSTGLFSFEPKQQDMAKARRFVEALQIFQIGVSWGGFESLVVPLQVSPIAYSKPRLIVRLYAGVEDAEDLIDDIDQAFAASGLG